MARVAPATKVIVGPVQTVVRARKAILPPGLIAGLVPREIVAHALTVVRVLRRLKPVRSVRGRQRVDAPNLRKSSIPSFTAGNLANVGRNRAGRGCITVKAVQFGWKAEPGEDAHGQRQYDHLL